MTSKDYYAILEISRKASAKEIKQAYRRLARRYHPDLHPGDKFDEDMFKAINEAYEVLSDPVKRQEYGRLQEELLKREAYNRRQQADVSAMQENNKRTKKPSGKIFGWLRQSEF